MEFSEYCTNSLTDLAEIQYARLPPNVVGKFKLWTIMTDS
jgi:hypothetical protein